MQQSFGQRPVAAPAIVGVLLIALGAVALALRQVGVDFFSGIGDWGWPLFIIVPGTVLLVVSLLPVPPAGIGFAIAGAIITTVGSILLYQSRTGDWESWAYAWALIPTAAGCALLLYGAYVRRPSMIRGGTWLAGIGAVLFAVGAWFFQGLFSGAHRPEIDEWLPAFLVGLGAVLVFGAVVINSQRRDPGAGDGA